MLYINHGSCSATGLYKDSEDLSGLVPARGLRPGFQESGLKVNRGLVTIAVSCKSAFLQGCSRRYGVADIGFRIVEFGLRSWLQGTVSLLGYVAVTCVARITHYRHVV